METIAKFQPDSVAEQIAIALAFGMRAGFERGAVRVALGACSSTTRFVAHPMISPGVSHEKDFDFS